MVGRVVQQERGQTSTEYVLITSVIVMAVVAAAYTFIPLFETGVETLAADIDQIMTTHQIGGVGLQNGSSDGTVDAAVQASQTVPSAPPDLLNDGANDRNNEAFKKALQDLLENPDAGIGDIEQLENEFEIGGPGYNPGPIIS